MKALFTGSFGDTEAAVLAISNHAYLDLSDIGGIIRNFSEDHFSFFCSVISGESTCFNAFELNDHKTEFSNINLKRHFVEASAILESALGSFFGEFKRYFQDYVLTDSPGMLSESSWSTPGLIKLNYSIFEKPVRAAEHMFHESLHQKLYFHHLVGAFFGGFYSPEVMTGNFAVSPSWHAGDERFNLERRIAAAHIYIHLLCFYSSLLGENDCEEWKLLAIECLNRFRELTLSDQEIEMLGPYGRNFMQWLNSLDPKQSALRATQIWQSGKGPDSIENLALTNTIALFR